MVNRHLLPWAGLHPAPSLEERVMRALLACQHLWEGRQGAKSRAEPRAGSKISCQASSEAPSLRQLEAAAVGQMSYTQTIEGSHWQALLSIPGAA